MDENKQCQCGKGFGDGCDHFPYIILSPDSISRYEAQKIHEKTGKIVILATQQDFIRDLRDYKNLFLQELSVEDFENEEKKKIVAESVDKFVEAFIELIPKLAGKK